MMDAVSGPPVSRETGDTIASCGGGCGGNLVRIVSILALGP